MATWKKGALHCHSIWSDGRCLPEVILHLYKNKLGYDFVSITDHNLFQGDPQTWQWVNHNTTMFESHAFSLEAYNWSREVLGEKADDMLETKKSGFRRYVRIKDYESFRAQFEEPGKFLVIPGNEISLGGFRDPAEGGFVCHMNVINQKKDYPKSEQIPTTASQSEVVRAVCEEYKELAGDTLEDSFIMSNHPFWMFWDLSPVTLLDVPEIKFFEVCNSGARPDAPKDPVLTVEKFWDFVLAHRLDRGQGLLYGTATDDAHNYHPDKTAVPGFSDTGFVMVKCEDDFSYSSIVAAMKRGDFYASCGVYLDDVEFDKDTKTLNVKVKAEDGVKYRVEFITTKRDFDRTIKLERYTFEKTFFNRELPVVPENIGVVAKTVEGCEASYKMTDDDLYVRAIIYSDKPGRIKDPFYYPEYECAWTQPVC